MSFRSWPDSGFSGLSRRTNLYGSLWGASPVAWGVVLGAIVGSLVLVTYHFSQLNTTFFLPASLIGLMIALIGGALTTGALLVIVVLLRRIPAIILASLAGTLGVSTLVLWIAGVIFPLPLLTAVISITVFSLLGLVGGLAYDLLHRRPSHYRLFSGLLLLSMVAAMIYGGLWLRSTGTDDHLRSVEGNVFATPLALPNPSEGGPYPVRSLSYGYGDERRPQYGADASVRTRSVDLTPFLPSLAAWRSNHRRRYWGFSPNEAPLNGLVWHPEGEGPFPLVLLVPGNHAMHHPSEAGYAYLGELLASRGHIVVSIDQNFLNLSWSGDDFQRQEIPARAVLILEHLKLWRDWNTRDESPIGVQADLDNIALIGHSRGGEAIAVATLFNRLHRYPEDASITLDFDFGIRSLVALAPSDQFYLPGDRSVQLDDVSYLVLHGGHDGDVATMLGLNQYHRINVDHGDHFKTAVYVYGANHSQFNTEWGRLDVGFPAAPLLNTQPIMEAADQQRLAQVYISAFLAATLGEDPGYRPLFRQAGYGAEWLPTGAVLSQYRDATYRAIVDVCKDGDPGSGAVADSRIDGSNFSLWREGKVPLRIPLFHQDTQGVFLRWEEPASYTLTIPPGWPEEWDVQETDTFCLTLARLDNQPTQLDITVSFVDDAGHRADVPLSRYYPHVPYLPVQSTKLGLLEQRLLRQNEVFPIDYELPLLEFVASEPDLHLGRVTQMELTFGNPPGHVVITSIGLRQGY